MLIRGKKICLNSLFQVYRTSKLSQDYNSSGTSNSAVIKPGTEIKLPMSQRTKISRIVGGRLWGNILHFLDTVCIHSEVVIIILQRKHIWRPTNRRNDGSWRYFGYSVKRKDTDKLVRNSTVILCTCSNVIYYITLGSN